MAVSSDQSFFQKRITCKRKKRRRKKETNTSIKNQSKSIAEPFSWIYANDENKRHVISTMKSMKDVFKPIRQFGMNLTQKRSNHFHRL